MRTLIAEKMESEELHRFHADFRRALLMHRKAALNLFFRLQFPVAENPLCDGETAITQTVSIGAAESASDEPIRRSLNERMRPCIGPSNPAATGLRWVTRLSLNKTEEACEKEFILKKGDFS